MSESSNKLKTSFSSRVKEELFKEIEGPRHCRIAEIAGITALGGFIYNPEKKAYFLKTDSSNLDKKYFTLLSKTISISECADGINRDIFNKICKLLKVSGEGEFSPINEMLLIQECCKKAFLRGAFLAAGSVNDPNKSYHLEIVSDREELAETVSKCFNDLGVPAKITRRKSNYVVYIKDGTMLVEALGLMGAPLRLMEVENVRILKDMRNDLNRKVNCEAANIRKTISAALSLIEDIDYIDETVGLSELPGSLEQIARLRRQYPEATLSELGQMLNPAVGKSGINHRLRRIAIYAESLRKEE